MRKFSRSGRKPAFMIVLLLSAVLLANGQNTVQDMNSQGSLEQQLKFVEEHTKIYENFRAVREDMFQKLKDNVVDSLSASKRRIAELKKLNSSIQSSYDSLQGSVASTQSQLDQMTETKESISFLGIDVNKGTYNMIMWTLVLALLIIMGIGYIVFNRNRIITNRTKQDIEELKEEFANYRKTSREAREKENMAHFNEIQRLRGRS